MSSRDEILEKLTRIVESHISDEGFGVGQLAEAYGISRSTLLRLLKKHAGMSASRFIKEVRLEHARFLLDETDKTISEISFSTGFSSPSYFIKCFREKYGRSPGETRIGQQVFPPVSSIHPEEVIDASPPGRASDLKVLDASATAERPFQRIPWLGIALSLLTLLSLLLIYRLTRTGMPMYTEGKSIAVLPFKNESTDSTNVYFINGMMESILNNLQKIGNLRVISRTSVERYRHKSLSIPEIAQELGVDYIVEGSGQKLGDQILLSVQLIDASKDRRIWSEQFQRKYADVFRLQAEVSGSIASRIEVVVSPAVRERMEAIPTENLEAYDLYLKGMEYIREQTTTGLDSALAYYDQAIQLDPDFAHAYAYTAICYYYQDLLKAEKVHQEELERYSDKALLLDGDLPEGLISRGLFYMQTQRYEQAIEYFEKVLELNPNSVWTHNYLSEIYNLYLPDSEKYLIHALSVLRLDLSGANDNDLSTTHLIIANAFCQSGMMDKAKEHIQQSLQYNPDNIYSQYLDIYIDLASDLDLERARLRMEVVFAQDTMRLDVLKELANLSYSKRDFATAYDYYDRLVRRKESLGYRIFPEQDIEIAYVMRIMGEEERAEEFRRNFVEFTESTPSIYTPFHRALIHLYDGEQVLALNDLDEFIQNKDYMFWVVLMIEDDPLFSAVRSDHRFRGILENIRVQFEQRKRARIDKLKAMGLWEPVRPIH